MTQIWQGENVVAVTKVQAGPCRVVQVKNSEKDGYEAIQVGFGKRHEKNINKPQRGHFKGLDNFQHIKEFRAEPGELKRGDTIDAGTFAPGDNIQVTAVNKGKGFQGVVRKYGFKGSKKTHGNKDQLRMPGSIGATGPAHVFKGTRMGGRMGGEQTTIKNLKIAAVDIDDNTILISGAIPGARNSLVLVSGEGELKIQTTDNRQQTAEKNMEKNKIEEDNKKVESKTVETQNIAPEIVETQNIAPEKDVEAKNLLPETPKEVEKEVVEAKEKVDEKKKEDKKFDKGTKEDKKE